jgi:hypothetical protein
MHLAISFREILDNMLVTEYVAQEDMHKIMKAYEKSLLRDMQAFRRRNALICKQSNKELRKKLTMLPPPKRYMSINPNKPNASAKLLQTSFLEKQKDRK